MYNNMSHFKKYASNPISCYLAFRYSHSPSNGGLLGFFKCAATSHVLMYRWTGDFEIYLWRKMNSHTTYNPSLVSALIRFMRFKTQKLCLTVAFVNGNIKVKCHLSIQFWNVSVGVWGSNCTLLRARQTQNQRRNGKKRIGFVVSKQVWMIQIQAYYGS